MKPKASFHTLGCKLNFSESSALMRSLEEAGYERVEFPERADLYVINTCSVTENADRDCRKAVRDVRKQNPNATVVMTGCYAQLKPEQVAAIPGVDLVIGTAEKFSIVRHLSGFTKGPSALIHSCEISLAGDFHPAWSGNDRTRSFLKIQDGCDYPCTYCTIPMARGKSRSHSLEGVLKNAMEISSRGIREIVLTGVNTGDFGLVDGNRLYAFIDLIRELDRLDIPVRFRISSIEPNLLSDEIISFVATSQRFMPHFHIPLQSGCDRILALMKRRYRRDLYAGRVSLIRELMPHACIGADVITGFPSESDEDFNITFRFLEELSISYLHVFTYSERENTEALNIKPVVPVYVRRQRNERLRQLSLKKQELFRLSCSGQSRPVLFESPDDEGYISGYTDNYIRVRKKYRQGMENMIMEVKLSDEPVHELIHA